MSHTESSCTTCKATEKPCVRESTEHCKDEFADKTTGCGSPERSTRDRVLKEVGLTSTAFIGPAFPPETATVKSDIEDSLSEFYKELEKIDKPDCANGNPGKQDAASVQPLMPPKIPSSKETQDVIHEKTVNTGNPAETDGRRKQSSWSHWYQNEPYYPRRQRPGLELSSASSVSNQNQRRYAEPLNRPPNTRFHQSPFPHRPPLSAFRGPENPLPHVNPTFSSSGMTNQYQATLSRFPPLNVYSHPSQGFHGESPRHVGRDQQGCSYDTHSDNVTDRWTRDREEEWSQFDEDYYRPQRLDSENELWEQQHHYQARDRVYQPSALVLILMRGLPGSGKSTLARELLSTGPSGIILSTDDYFAHKDGYHYDPGFLGAAHEWNQSRAKDALHDGRSPIIIDNTNIQAWEMKPYVKMALERGYEVDFCEPDTSWKFDPYELEKRNKHRVPQEKIAQMLDRFSFPISIDIVMSSQEPQHVNQRRRTGQPQMMRKNQHFHSTGIEQPNSFP